jgi:catechol 2,3-dioxygenase-like lactoylglutathione lyase family enzyme
MRVTALDHVNIRTRDVSASARFYADLLGLEARNPPVDLPPDQARWLFDGSNHPIIHLFKFDTEPGSTGPIHHVALRCSGKDALLERLQRLGTEYSLNEVPSIGMTQIFVRDPHGVLLELNFGGD